MQLKNIQGILSGALIGALTCANVFLGGANIASANTLLFVPVTYLNSSATTTAGTTYITAGTATTTFQLDTTALPGGFANDAATLLVRFTSTTSPTAILNINVEYSQDCIDWYEDGGVQVNSFATTTKPFYLAVNQFVFNFASTTAGLAAPGAQFATSSRALLIKTPTRCTRAVFSVPIGSNPAAVFAEWVPIRQRLAN